MIYFIQSGDTTGPIKIGTTKRNIHQRVKALQVGSSAPLKLIALLKGGTTEELILHNKFSHLRINGEWFKLDDDLLEFISTVATPVSIMNVPTETIDQKFKSASLNEILNEIEAMYVHYALERAKGNKTEAAHILGISLRSMRYRSDIHPIA